MIFAKKIVIVGVSNSGKSTLFTQLTKKFTMTANCPYTTIEEQRTFIRLNEQEYILIDTPGISSLDVFSEQEQQVRDLLMKEKPSMIIQCVEEVNIKRSLLLTAQLIELNIPLVICLNFVDEARRRGIWVDSLKLKELLKVPVVETIANRGIGIKELVKEISNARRSHHCVTYQENISERIDHLQSYFPNHPSQAAMTLIVSHNADILDWVKGKYGNDIYKSVKDNIKRLSPESVKDRILEARSSWVEDIASNIVHRSEIIINPVIDRISELTRHPVWGWPVLMGVLGAIYFFVVKIGAITVSGWLDSAVFSPITETIAMAIPWQFLKEFLVGPYGLLSMGVFSAIGTVFPILTIFFIILSLLEDIGYIPNLCVLTNNFLKILGLSGKAVLPLTLGLGCKTMAILSTKTLDSWKERYIAIFTISSGIPCSSQLSLYLGILAFFPFSAALIVAGVLAIRQITAIVVLNKLIRKDETTDFILEIPPIRAPNLKNLVSKVYYQMKNFFMEVFPLFIVGSLALFTIDKIGMLALIKEIASPLVVSFLSLPIKVVDGFILCLGSQALGAAVLLNMAREGGLSYINTIVCIVVIMGLIPCLNSIMAMIKQLKLKQSLIMLPLMAASSILAGGVINWFLRLIIGGVK